MDLEAPLVSLGARMASETVKLLAALSDDAFFFRNSPVEPGELDTYETIVGRLEASGLETLTSADRNRLLRLALRYTPSRHKMVSIPKGLADGILMARFRFMKEIGGWTGSDIERCRSGVMSSFENMTPPLKGENRFHSIYCPADYLYSRSLLENVFFGIPRAGDGNEDRLLIDLAIHHLKAEGLLDVVMDIGLDFQVGSKGDRLSGGQKQKVAVARALLKAPDILIMDEATASLDNVSQSRIQNYIGGDLRGKTTVISVVHRLDLTPAYDRILLLKAGVLMETGTYDQLMAKQGLFYELVRGNG